jgi:hypothetical protein
MKPGFHELTEAQYHGDPCPVPSLSASIAKVLVGRSPRIVWPDPPAWAEVRYSEKSVNQAFDQLQDAHGVQA